MEHLHVCMHGKHLYTADTLSHAPVTSPDAITCQESAQTELFVQAITSNLPASADCLKEYRATQEQDSTCSQLIAFYKDQLTGDLLRYWHVRAARSLYCGATKPTAGDTTQNPSGHQGILQCRLCVSSAVWWPGIKHQVEQLVRSCPACTQASLAHRQPMISYPLPNYPWEKVASDLFELHCKTYLLVADYFSRYLEVQTLTTTTSASVIRALIAIFSRHGIPAVLMSDNGPQYSSQEMKDFANQYNFKHVTSSPHYPQSNGMAEHMVKTAKSQQIPTWHYTLAYRTTTLPWCGISPVQLAMCRHLRTDIPQVPSTLILEWSHLTSFHQKDAEVKRKQKADYDRCHRARSLLPLPNSTPVWVRTKDRPDPGRVIQSADTPRSYLVEVPSGTVRRNQSHLSRRPEADSPQSIPETPERRVIATRLQTGTHVGPPSRLTYWKRGDMAYW